MKQKIRLGIIFGGRSFEHEVSLQSARSVIKHADPDKYEVVLIGIDKQGQWHLQHDTKCLLNADNPKLIRLNSSAEHITSVMGRSENQLVSVSGDTIEQTIDVAFPVMHGVYGEDGTIQGLLKLANIPFVGASILGSAIGMDKEAAKRLLRDAGIPTAKFLTFRKYSGDFITFEKVAEHLGVPFFIKPANSGSSVGIHKVKIQQDFEDAVKDAFQYDTKIIAEEFIQGREIECAVLGNAEPKSSIPGEIIPNHEFYSYEAKYIDENGAALAIPADLPDDITEKIRQYATDAFICLCCEGMARVDFFVTKDYRIYLNEINTIPGFTKISMYPKLWEASGIQFSKLIDTLVELAVERHQRESRLKTYFF